MKNKKSYNRKRIQYLLFLLFYLYAGCDCKLAAQPAGIKYLHFTRHDVLATDQVNCILQDKKKFMWFATSNGIQRFDGNRWVWLAQQKNTATSLPDNDVAFLLEDRKDRLWVQTSSGISLLNRDNLQFTNIKIAWLPEHRLHTFRSLVALPDGHIWFTLAEGGLYCYDEAKEQFIPADKMFPPSAWMISQLAYDSNRHQYFFGTDKGIVIYDVQTKQFYHSGFNPTGIGLLKTLPAQEVNVALYLNSNDQLWFSGFATHSCYDLKKDSLIFCDSISRTWGVLGYTTDKSGITWSYGSNISKMNLFKGIAEPIGQSPEQPYGINFQNGGYIMEDGEGTYWIATTNGVYIYNRFQQQFFQHVIKSYATGDVFKHINVWGFIELADSTIAALTTRGEGLYFFNKDLNQLPSKFNLAPYANAKSWVNIRCGVRDKEDHLWVGCEKGPLLKLYPENGKVEKIIDSSFAGMGIYSMTADDNGDIWIGTFHHAIIRRDAVTGKFSTIVPPWHQNGLDNVFCLFYDDGYIWAATSKSGLLKINTKTNAVEKTYTNNLGDSSPIPASRVYTIAKSGANQLMMSTPDGIAVMDIAKENFRLLTTADGLPDNNASILVDGQQQSTWIASDNGVSQMKPDKMNTTSYGVPEGLTSESFNIGAGLQLADGRILMGHNEGFTSFNPAAFLKEAEQQEVKITGIKLFDKYLDIDSIFKKKNEMVLDYNQNYLTIEFSNMSFLMKAHVSYRYQMEGLDKDWINADAMPQATYTYLPGGSYIFKVKCSNKNGIEKIASFRIRIIPPVWKQWWFYVFAVAAISGLIYFFFSIRYRQQIQAEQVRNRIAKDLHDDMGSTLSTINILSEIAKTKIDTDIPTTKKFIHQISHNSNRIMESLDDIVWNIDTANDTTENTMSRMREFAGNLLEARGISYTFKEDEKLKNINLELGRRHDFFMIFKEAINNLAKYSECTTVNIDVSVKKNILALLITDDGKGFENNFLFEGNGLTNMHQRAAALKGSLSIQSEINKGTTVDLQIPV